MQKLITIVAPVFNEAAMIDGFHQRLRAILQSLDGAYAFEIIYVLDKSSDDTKEHLRAIARADPGVTVLALSRRFGHQMSLVAGIDSSHGEAVIMMDSDLQHPPDLIPEMLEKYERGHHIVQAVRIDEQEIGFLRNLLSRTFYKVLNLLTPIRISINAPDFRLISAHIAGLFRDSIREQDQFLRGLFSWVGFETAYVPFTCPAREKGATKYNFRRRLVFAVTGVVSFSKVPLSACILIGGCISILSLAYGTFVLLDYWFNETLPAGWASVITTVAFLGGLQLMFLGVLGEYIGRIFDEVKHRPLYIVEEVLGEKRAHGA